MQEVKLSYELHRNFLPECNAGTAKPHKLTFSASTSDVVETGSEQVSRQVPMQQIH